MMIIIKQKNICHFTMETLIELPYFSRSFLAQRIPILMLGNPGCNSGTISGDYKSQILFCLPS